MEASDDRSSNNNEDMTAEQLEELLSSSLTKLTPSETKRARCANYRIFRKEWDEMRYGYLFDQVPFRIEAPLDRKKLHGCFDVYYHDEQIDWGGLSGWEAFDNKKDHEHDHGSIMIAGCNDLEGCLFFIPNDFDWLGMNSDDGSNDHLSDEDVASSMSFGSDGSDIESAHDDEEESSGSGHANDSTDDECGEEDNESSISRCLEVDSNEQCSDRRDSDSDNNEDENNDEHGFDTIEGDDCSDSDSDESANEYSNSDDENDDEQSFGSIVVDSAKVTNRLMKSCKFFHFDERRFELEPQELASYELSSWYGMDCRFGLIHAPTQDHNINHVRSAEPRRNDSITLLVANESMAFARGTIQQFVSLENPSNYGTECGSHYGRFTYLSPDNTHRINVVKTMQTYRNSSWICKLCPSNTMISNDVAQLILEYWQTSPPPFLFVKKGDLLLLARYEEFIRPPDPYEQWVATVTREHLVLACPNVDGDCFGLT